MSKRPRQEFCHLHVHSEYSMLDGASRLRDLAQAAAADGQPGLGLTDHGNLYGVLEHYRACQAAGIKPVIGLEAYMAAESRFDRAPRRGRAVGPDGESSGQKLYYHLLLLATSNIGYSNLVKLSSLAYLEGYHYKPRLDFELLDRYHEGLVATTGCLGGLVLQALLADELDRATALASRLQDIFGRENLFVELQDHGLVEQKRTNPLLIDLARRIGAPLLATNDSHYTHRQDAPAHDALLCVQTGALKADQNRFRFHGEEHYLKSAAEMWELFGQWPTALTNSVEIVDRCDVKMEFGQPRLPRPSIPPDFEGDTYEEGARRYLRHLSYTGAARRYPGGITETVSERLDYELGVISDMGFDAYFLVVADLIDHARQKRIRVGPGRGSAAGSCVAYCLGIVDIDPIRYGLIFERFLNPGRRQMPDIDMDFDERYRGEMIRYAAERYGSDHVAQIVTFSRIKARAAVRDAARVLGYPYSVGDRIAKAMPPLILGRDTPLGACLEPVEGYEEGYKMAASLREMYQADPDVREVIDTAKGLEGLCRQDGIHAAAVVITADPLIDQIPIQRKPEAGQAPEEAPIVTQFEMHGVEDLGLLKMDFLGLRNLSTIERALDLIETTTSIRPNLEAIPTDDEKTFAMLCRGDSLGVFQLEGGPMRSLMRSLAPSCLDDVAALVALYRPGPMAANMHNDYADRKNGRQPVTYPHPDLEPVLRDTYGLMIYQESVMRVAEVVAGYTLAEADNLRKACGKKIRALIAAEREKFVAGCEATGYGAELGTALFDIIEPFADYAFNKSHAYGYGLVAYQTAWLKANYPVEYLAALLTSVQDDKDRTAIYLAECRSLQIEVVLPDVNKSGPEFTPENGRILFGLAAIRNVGRSLVDLIVEERCSKGPFRGFEDFCHRVDVSVLNKRTVESLIKAGAFDSLGCSRGGLLRSYESVLDATIAKRREREAGLQSLFGDDTASGGGAASAWSDHIPEVKLERSALLQMEKEMLGLYVSDHPMADREAQVAAAASGTIAQAIEARSEGPVTLGGVITGLNRRFTRKGDEMAIFFLEDLTGSIEAVAYPRSYEACQAVLAAVSDSDVVLVRGRLDVQDDQAKVVVQEVAILPEAPPGPRSMEVRLAPKLARPSVLKEVADLLAAFPGDQPVILCVGSRRFDLGVAVDSRPGLVGELRSLLGENAVAV
jgi:DNA polymerase-3 subunit alpha